MEVFVLLIKKFSKSTTVDDVLNGTALLVSVAVGMSSRKKRVWRHFNLYFSIFSSLTMARERFVGVRFLSRPIAGEVFGISFFYPEMFPRSYLSKSC